MVLPATFFENVPSDRYATCFLGRSDPASTPLPVPFAKVINCLTPKSRKEAVFAPSNGSVGPGGIRVCAAAHSRPPEMLVYFAKHFRYHE